MKAIITGGGTGGHIYPALSIAFKLKDDGFDILYVGSKKGMETKIVPEKGLPLKTIDVEPIPRKISPLIIRSLFMATKGFFQSRKIIREFKPDIVIGTGGFVAGPVVFAAGLSGFNTLIHEQNVYPGITTKILSYTVDKIALNFKETKKHLNDRAQKKCVITGNPIREEILNMKRKEGAKNLNISPDRKTILVFGGSQGAKSINQAMEVVCEKVKDNKNIQIIYLTGEKNYQQVIENLTEIKDHKNIIIKPYLHNMEWAYAVADLVVYRAGATGLAEITAKGIPAILIPYPHSAENHQEYNARNLEKNEAAEVITDKDLTGKLLTKKIIDLLNDQKKLKVMSENSKKMGKPQALTNITEIIKKMI